jgi:predicted YcjX-like family ATPase
MKPLTDELGVLLNRGFDRHMRLAVTGLSGSGKTAFITALVNQLLHLHYGARLPLFTAAREQRVLGVKRVAQRDLSIARFAYDEGIAALQAMPATWPVPTRGVSEIQLALRFRTQDPLRRYLKEHSTLYLEIVDYPGEWLLDLPMLEQDYLAWSQQMNQLLKNSGNAAAQQWLIQCQHCDPFAPADENQLADIAAIYTDYLHQAKQHGGYFIQPGRVILPGELAGAPVLQFFPWCGVAITPQQLAQAKPNSTIAMLAQRYHYYCQHVVKAFYQAHFVRFDRQIVLVDCLQALNQGYQACIDMQMALRQLMRSFHYGKRTLLRRLFSPCIDKLMFAASKIDHVTRDQHGNLVQLLQSMVQDPWQQAAFEGIKIECCGIASVQASENGTVDYQGKVFPAIKGYRLSDGSPITYFPGEVPTRLPDALFWQTQGFDFSSLRPLQITPAEVAGHCHLDNVMEFLLGDKLR